MSNNRERQLERETAELNEKIKFLRTELETLKQSLKDLRAETKLGWNSPGPIIDEPVAGSLPPGLDVAQGPSPSAQVGISGLSKSAPT